MGWADEHLNQFRKRLTTEEKERLECDEMDDDFDPDCFDTDFAREFCKEYSK